ncbi:MAG: DNA polymerase III subunit beta [Kofleriaceae bacterium]
MDFKIAKTEFLRGLRLAQSIADRKSTMPMLSNVLLRTVGKNKLMIAATDLNVSVIATLSSKNAVDGGLTINAKSLHDIVGSAPGDELRVVRADNNWAEIKAGKVNYRIVGMPDRDFPKLPDAKDGTLETVDAQPLREMIDRTMFSVCNDETRFHLNGVLFESTGAHAKMISTDGHRLSKVERDLAGGPSLTAGVIIPKKGLLELKRVLEGAGSVQLAIRSPHLFVVEGDITLAVKLIDAQFPPYDQVIPKDHKRTVVIDRLRLIDSLKRASLMTSDTRGVKFSVDEASLTITSDNPDQGEVREELEADYQGQPIAIGFNPKYVLELLGQMSSDQVGIHLGGELDPGMFKPLTGDDYLGVVMPMRI